jgi:hypothetical protein
MKTRFTIQQPNQNGTALMLVMIMSAIALAIVAGVMTWSATSNKLTHRSIQYTRSVAAAEAATEKVESQITRDFLYGGESLVVNNLNSYRQTVPTPSDSSYWNTWVFDDGNGNLNQTYVQGSGTNYVELDPPYAGLKGFVSIYTVVSHARDTASPQDVTAGVLQELELTSIPIFQMGMYSSGDMEISCGQPFDVTGHVHSNGNLYVEPDNNMTFESDVTAVVKVFSNPLERDPLDTRGPPAGSVVFVQTNSPSFPVTALTLPIGTTNTPEAIREIIEPPQSGEDPTSPLGRLRYYNLCDMVLIVSNTTITAVSGYFNPIKISTIGGLIAPTNELMASFVTITGSFYDGREGKTVQPIDINIGNLTSWSLTNSHGFNLSSLYVVDDRTLPAGNLGAVRVFNGTNLPPNGLTVVTGRPLYVQGDYNELNLANLGTTNTTATRPASLAADAITFLSDNWKDINQQSASLNTAAPTTVNAALLTGDVETTLGQYSGGMENFPRFLESWGLSNTNTYNGSMVKMFPSLYATNVWKGIGYANHYYDPPARNWAYDTSFDDPLKLPPVTPRFQTVKRHQWATVPAGTNAVAATP